MSKYRIERWWETAWRWIEVETYDRIEDVPPIETFPAELHFDLRLVEVIDGE